MLLAPDLCDRFDFLHACLGIPVDHFFIAIEALSRRCLSNTIGCCSSVVMLGVLMVDMANVGSGNDGLGIVHFYCVGLRPESAEEFSHCDGFVLREDQGEWQECLRKLAGVQTRP